MNCTDRGLRSAERWRKTPVVKVGVPVAWIALGVVLGSTPDGRLPLAPAAFAIAHVTVIDTAGGPAQPDQTVVVSNARIIAVARNASIPEGATVVDGSGKFLIPGLWDMHVHSLNAEWIETFFPLFVANGVTGVRDMARPLADFRRLRDQWRAEIADGTRVGPRVVAAGPSIDGPRQIFPYLSVATASEAREAVRTLRGEGVDFIKVYTGLPRDAYFAVADEAARQGLAFVGHTPNGVSAMEASDAGQRSFEHLFGVLLACSHDEEALRRAAVAAMTEPQGPNSNEAHWAAERDSVAGYDAAKANALFSRFAKNGSWQVPTLVILRQNASDADPLFEQDDRLRYVTPDRRAQWAQQSAASRRNPARGDAAARKRVFQKQVEVVRLMNRAGVPLLAGTDTPGNYSVPGFALHDELELLVGAGLTPLEALQTATLNPAKLLKMDDRLGTIQTGKIADLVLLEGNPLDSIANTRKIAAVVANGRLLSSAALKQTLADVERLANRR